LIQIIFVVELMDGNARHVAQRPTAPRRDLELPHERTAESQEPFAATLSCADSRVPGGASALSD
jgi:carbonic anhydrase